MLIGASCSQRLHQGGPQAVQGWLDRPQIVAAAGGGVIVNGRTDYGRGYGGQLTNLEGVCGLWTATCGWPWLGYEGGSVVLLLLRLAVEGDPSIAMVSSPGLEQDPSKVPEELSETLDEDDAPAYHQTTELAMLA